MADEFQQIEAPVTLKVSCHVHIAVMKLTFHT